MTLRVFVPPAWLVLALLCAPPAQAGPAEGRALFADARKGNCIACHKAPGDALVKSVATVGPALEGIKERFPERAKLRDFIWDATRVSPNTIMPPYGRHRILSDGEIDAIADYLETL